MPNAVEVYVPVVTMAYMVDVIQSLWVGSRLSTMERLCIKSYQANGHPFHLYAYQELEGVPQGCVMRDANKIVPESRIFTYQGSGFGRGSLAGFADLFRYKLLLERGGWWVDTDSICLRPFDFTADYVFSSEAPATTVNCGNLKAPAGSAMYQWLVDQCKTVNPQMYWGAIGPSLMKRAVARFKVEKYVQPPATFCSIPYDLDCKNLLLPRRGWPFNASNYAVHLWNEAWRAKKLDKDAEYDPSCLYERLKSRYAISGGSADSCQTS